LSRYPARVQVYEVGPRDGLQNESAFVPTEDKLALIGALAAAGLPRVEATSFVHPRWIPPLADADRVASGLPTVDGTLFTALVPNQRGLDRALAAGMREVAVFMSASETHNQRNINKSRDETYTAFEPVFAACAAAGVAVRAYVSTAWGCPYEGDVAPAEVAGVARRLVKMGAYAISLGDTIGVGNPAQTHRVLDAVEAVVPIDRVALHMHDTRGCALANCLVGLERGVTTFDASIAGLGGCPYAPGASGNLATEDLVYMLHGMGIETGVDLDRLVDAGLLAQRLLGRTLPGRALQALAAGRSEGKS
jgi:hydroxymethylglutaryl-CoA lyase